MKVSNELLERRDLFCCCLGRNGEVAVYTLLFGALALI